MATTPNLGLYEPAVGETGWGGEDKVDGNWDILDTAVQGAVDATDALEADVTALSTRLTDRGVSVKEYGAVGNGVTDDSTAIQAAIDSGVSPVIFPPGNYVVGTTLSVHNAGQRIIGAGRGRTRISTNGVYAFTIAANTFEYFIGFFDIMSGGTAGGAVKAINGTSGGRLEDIYADCSGVLATPMYDMAHQIGTLVLNCQASGNYSATGSGFKWGSAGYNNTNTMVRCRAAAQNGPGVLYVSGWGFHMMDCTIESNLSYGVEFNGDCSGITIDRCWFEANGNHHIYAHGLGLYASTIRENNIYYTNAGGDANACSIKITTENANLRHHVQIIGNYFVDSANSGIGIYIGPSVYGTYIQGNRVGSGYGTSFLHDEGASTLWWANDNYVSNMPFYRGKLSISTGMTGASGALNIASGGRNTGENSNPVNRMLAVGELSDSGTSNWVGVTTEGHLDIHTANGGPTVNVLQTGSFSPYYNKPTNWLQFYQRTAAGGTGSGSYVVADVGHGYGLQTAATPSSTPGALAKRIPVWDESTAGVIGYLPVYTDVGQGMVMSEISDPAAPAANNVVIYAKDNGAGKTQLCARFPGGDIVVLGQED